MAMIKIFQGKSKPAKKKPGWRQAEAEYQAWLNQTKSMTSGIKTSSKVKPANPIKVTVGAPVVASDRLNRGHSLVTPGGAGTKPVHRPDIVYRDDPELLQRELIARSRKFNVAPIYNKGPLQFISDDIDEDIKSGSTRRRS